jgi:hypothetical protein
MVTTQFITGTIEDAKMPLNGRHQAEHRFAERGLA